MAAAVSTFGAVSRTPLSLNGSGAGATVLPSSTFMGKKVSSRASNNLKAPSGSFKVVAVKEIDEKKQTDQDRWKGLIYDTSDDQQDITRGKGMVDSLFQAPMGAGTHDPIMSSYDYISAGLRTYLDNNMDGLYIAPAFMDKLVVHITKNFMTLPNIKVPLILGIWGGKGQGKSFQCELVFAKMGISPIMMSAGELESGNAGEPAKLIRQRYREAADIIKKGKMCCLFINDLDAGAGRMGGTTQYTVNNQMVNATLMNIADNPTNVQLPGMYNKEENPRVPIIVTGNDFSTLYAPLIRDGRMEKFYWAPTREDRIGVCTGIFRADNVPKEDIVKLVDTFPGQSIDFFGALRARVYDDEVRKWISGVGVEKIGKKLVNSKEGPPTFEQPKMTLDKLLEYGNMLVQEQENVKRVQLADKYLKDAALGDANKDAQDRGTFYGKEVQQVNVPVPEAKVPVSDVKVSVPEVHVPVSEVKSSVHVDNVPVPEVNVSVSEVKNLVPIVDVPVPEGNIPVSEVKDPVAVGDVPVPEVKDPVVVVDVPVSEVKDPVAVVDIPVSEVKDPVAVVDVSVPEVNIPVPEVQVEKSANEENQATKSNGGSKFLAFLFAIFGLLGKLIKKVFGL